jgi:tight adherence protein C
MDLLLYIMMTVAGVCVIGIIAAVMMQRAARMVSERALAVMQGQDLSMPTPKQQRSKEWQDRFFQEFRKLRSRLGMQENPLLLDRFVSAGLNSARYVDIYVAARALGPIVAVIAASFCPWKRVFLMTTGAGAAYLAPDIILTRLVKARRERIRRAIPDAVDLLVICVDAGLGMDQAMLRCGHELGKSHPDIQQEFLRINREQRAGKQRIDAWASMAKRNQLQELDAFVNMLMQTERFGTPIARALSQFGDSIRQKRRQRAEELAAKTTVKIIFPLVLCIFPSLFIVLLGPPGISIMRAMGTGQ